MSLMIVDRSENSIGQGMECVLLACSTTTILNCCVEDGNRSIDASSFVVLSMASLIFKIDPKRSTSTWKIFNRIGAALVGGTTLAKYGRKNET